MTIYIAGTGAQSGKSLVALGLMETLAASTPRLGLFRPIARDGEDDTLLGLARARYGLPAERCRVGVTEEQAHEILINEGAEALLERLFLRFKDMESACDRVVVVGSDFHQTAGAFEFTFNLELARNMGALLVPVLNGHTLDDDALLEMLHGVLSDVRGHALDLLLVALNRVSPAQAVALPDVVTQQLGVPSLVLPDLPMLGLPSVDELARVLGARFLLDAPVAAQDSGSGELPAPRSRDVLSFKVAAMELPHFLDHLHEGTLVITPGDRSDIILGSLAADLATSYPRIAALLLTGGLAPAPQVMRLLQGLNHLPVPVLSVEDDTFTTATRVQGVQGHLSADNPRKIAAALGVFEAHFDHRILDARLEPRRARRVTPMMFEYELIRQARAQRQRIVLPEGEEPRILQAAEIVRLRDIADLTLLGEEKTVRTQIARLGLDLSGVEIIDPRESELRETLAERYHTLRQHKGITADFARDLLGDVSYFGTLLVETGRADGMVSGAVHTTQETLRPALEAIRTAPGRKLVSSVFLMCLPDRVLVFGDCAVNPSPSAEQLADIAISSADTALRFGIEPRVAMLSYSTGSSGKGADVEKVREATALARALRPDLPIEGPIQYDAAIDPEVAATKMRGSPVAGRATVFVFPDLNTGNNTYKAVQRAAHAIAIGPVLQGLARPVNDLSRGCTVADIVNTIAITAIQAQSGKAPA